jgi:branched-chain amino acid transport system ATP-binding protein
MASVSASPGQIVGVIGPRRLRRKTTLFNSILGQIKPTTGRVEFCGEDITGMSPLESRVGVWAVRSVQLGVRQAVGA